MSRVESRAASRLKAGNPPPDKEGAGTLAGHAGTSKCTGSASLAKRCQPGTKGRALKGVMLQLCPARLNSHA